MAKRIRISLDADKLDPEQASMVLGELGEQWDYDYTVWEVNIPRRLEFGGERVGYWKVIEVDE